VNKMKILIIYGGTRLGNTWRATSLVKEDLQNYSKDIEFEEILLKDLNLPYCLGCSQCFRKGHTNCPHNGTIQMILDKMKEVISSPRPELSPYAPRMLKLKIHPDKIREVIGSGGKTINKIIDDTGVKIDIQSDGTIFIAALTQEAGELAIKIIENIVRTPEVGETYKGKVIKIMNFGAFVEILPGKEGLVHISNIAHERVSKVEDVLAVGDEIEVKIMEIDQQGKVNLSIKALLPKENDKKQDDQLKA